MPPRGERVKGYFEALAAFGVDTGGVPIFETTADPATIDAALAAIFAAAGAADGDPRRSPTGSPCGRSTGSKARGLAVPGEVSVIGFDGVPEGASTDPPLTTVSQPIVELGRRAVAGHHRARARGPARDAGAWSCVVAGLDGAGRARYRSLITRRERRREAEEREGQPHLHPVDEGEGGAAGALAPERGEELGVERQRRLAAAGAAGAPRHGPLRVRADRPAEPVGQEERQRRRSAPAGLPGRDGEAQHLAAVGAADGG